MKNSKIKAKPSAEPKADKPKGLTFFNFLNEINAGARGNNLLLGCTAEPNEGASPDSPDRKYSAFMINRGLSYFQDTILYANAMNERHNLPAVMQFDFLRFAIRPRKRFSAWAKKEVDSDIIQLIMDKYDYSAEKAREVSPLFNTKEIEKLKRERDIGGNGKPKK